MSARFQELAFEATPIGDISLRRRRDPATGDDVYEIKLDDDFLMSSRFTVAEEELARLALDRVDGTALDVVVGGLGLGYTARTVLESPRVATMRVVDALGPVIDWHRRGLIPAGAGLRADPRCAFVHGDFFAMVAGDGFDAPGRRYDAVIVDIDHSPRHLLHPRHAGFYDADGTRRLATHLRPGGVYALWSNDPPDDAYLAVLAGAFTDVRAEVVSFPNPLQERAATNTVYLATVPA
jgi:spermidine synthase